METENENHCVDCCCARSWQALGSPKYDARDIAEHIADLRRVLADTIAELGRSRKLKKQRDDLAEAITPFAAIASMVDELRHDEDSSCLWRLKARDVRRAAWALAKLEKEGK